MAATSAMAASSPSGEDAALSPRLDELAKPAARNAPPARQAAILGLPTDGAGSLQHEGQRVFVDVRFERGIMQAIEGLRAAGAQIVLVSSRYQMATVAIRPSSLGSLAGVDGVQAVVPDLAPAVHAAGCQGAATSEGDAQLRAALARSSFNLDGSGVTVGIISSNFDRDPAAATHQAQDIASGDLPGPANPCGHTTPVSVLDDAVSGEEFEDEGRGMAQIIHDLAPGASIAFATAGPSELTLASAIERLAKPTAQGGAGAQVIVDDIGYSGEPFFQDGPAAVAVNAVTAHGVHYFSAAGNENEVIEGQNVSSWEAPAFRSGGTCPGELATNPEYVTELNTSHCMDFNPGAGIDNAYGLVLEPYVEPGEFGQVSIDLQWAEPWKGVGTDLDAYLLNTSGEVVNQSVADNSKTQAPSEYLYAANKSKSPQLFFLVINRFGGGSPRLKFVRGQTDSLREVEYGVSSGGDVVGPTLYGHAAAIAGVTVAAVPYNHSTEAEAFTSQGPSTHYFGPVAGTAAAAPLSPPQVKIPDLAATDCGATTFFGRLEDRYRFCGTSAAAPHAAAVDALMLQSNPGLSFAGARSALAASATPVGSFGPTIVGAGLVNAFDAVRLVALPPTIAIASGPKAYSHARKPTLAFSANRPVTFACLLDGKPTQPCASPFKSAKALADGKHSIEVRGTDVAGRTGAAAVTFHIDTKAPRTSIVHPPGRVVSTTGGGARVSLGFRSNESHVKFRCRVDRGPFRPCGRKLKRRFRLGAHSVKVKALDRAGNIDHSPAVFRFRVARIHR